jgi:YVTN family beta-propeller protein
VPAPSGLSPDRQKEAAAGTGRRLVALIANSMSDTLTVADGRTLEPVSTIKVGREPHKFRQARASGTVYSCNSSGNEMLEIDPASLRIVRRIPILDPYNVVFTRDGRYLYKVAYRYDFVEIHDGHTFKPLRRLHTGRQPSHMWFSPDQRWFVNSNQNANTISVIDTQRKVVARQISVDALPAGVEISRDGQYLFVACHLGTIGVFSTDEWKLVKKVHSGKGAHEMAVTADGRTIYVTNRYEDTASVFDVAGQRVVEKFHVPGGPDMPVLSPREDQLWISGRFGNTATVVDTRSLKILNTFRTGQSPHGIFITGAA